MKKIIYILLLAISIALCGCAQKSETTETTHENPNLIKYLDDYISIEYDDSVFYLDETSEQLGVGKSYQVFLIDSTKTSSQPACGVVFTSDITISMIKQSSVEEVLKAFTGGDSLKSVNFDESNNELQIKYTGLNGGETYDGYIKLLNSNEKESVIAIFRSGDIPFSESASLYETYKSIKLSDKYNK